MLLPHILAKGNFRPKDITVSVAEQSNRLIDRGLESRIEEAWQARKEKAELSGAKMWDAVTYRLESIDADNEHLNISLGHIRYKVRASMRNIPGVYEYPDGYWPKGVFVTSIIKTSDDYYIFGELSGKTIVDKKYDTVGGVLTPEEGRVTNGDELFAAIYRELEEEINISNQQIKSASLRGAILTDFLNVGLFFEVELLIPRWQVQKEFEKKNDEELSGLVFVEPSDVKTFLSSIKHFGTAAAEIMEL